MRASLFALVLQYKEEKNRLWGWGFCTGKRTCLSRTLESHLTLPCRHVCNTGSIMDFRFSLYNSRQKNTHASNNCLQYNISLDILDDISPNNLYWIVRALTPLKGGSYWARWFQSWFRACVRETILFPHSLVSLLFTLFPICLPGYLFWEIVLSHHLFSWLSLYMGREGWSFQRSLLFLTISMIFRTNLAWLHASVFCLGSFALEGFQYASHHKKH